MAPPPLVLQTTYAELMERCAAAAFHAALERNGAFTHKTINGRRYWYFQATTNGVRTQRYVGPDTPGLLQKIEHHRQALGDARERRALVSMLVRSFGMPQPVAEIGAILETLAKAGVFRLRGVLIGTVAYQTYSAMLGERLPASVMQTGDVDIAQFMNVSAAVGDRIPPVLDVLKEADKTFRAIPTLEATHVTSYAAKNGLRVDFLTPNEGPETDKPRRLEALNTDAQPLRFLDFLIHEPEQAIVLHGTGIPVLVPSPQRFAVHKLIVSRRRPPGAAKQDKDLRQAEALLDILCQKRPFELGEAWNEAYERGPSWRQSLTEGMAMIAAPARDAALKTAGRTRATLPGIDLRFDDRPAVYDSRRDIVTFHGQALGAPVACAISRAALDDHFGASNLDNNGRLKIFGERRAMVQTMAREKYLEHPVEEPAAVLIGTMDVPKLLSKLL